MTSETRDRILLAVLPVILLVLAVVHYWTWLHTPKHLNFALISATLALFALVHAIYTFGWRAALLTLVALSALGWAVEEIGVRTGLPFGRYIYTDVLGWKLASVPWPIPFAWFMIVYLGGTLSRLIAGHGEMWSAWLRPIQAGLFATAYDLPMDPSMSGKAQAWLWLDGGHYFDVPFLNYAGWLVTAVVLALVAESIFAWIGEPRPGEGSRWAAVYPVIAYASLGVGYCVIGSPEATRLISFFAMGTPAVVAYWAWRNRHLGGEPIIPAPGPK